MVQGKAIHASLEKNYKNKLDTGQDISISDAQDCFSDYYDKAIKDTIDSDDTVRGTIKDASISYIDEYIKKVAPKITPEKVEEEFSTQITPSVRIKGFIDLIQKVSPSDKVIVDHKVTTKKKAQSDADSSLQLSIYSMATKIKKVRFDSLIPSRQNADEGYGYVPVVSERDAAQLKFDRSVIISVAEAISSGVFPKTGKGTWKCTKSFCPHFDKCHK
jgi:RecB family exonuclease